MPIKERHRGAKVAAAAIRGGLTGWIAGQEQSRRSEDQKWQREDRANQLAEAQAEVDKREQLRGFLMQSAQKDVERAEAMRAEITGENDLERAWADDVLSGAQKRIEKLGGYVSFLDDNDLKKAALEAGLEFEHTVAIAKDMGRAAEQIQSGIKHGFIDQAMGDQLLELMQPGTGVGPKEVRDRYYRMLDAASKQASVEQRLQRGMQAWSGVLGSMQASGVDEKVLDTFTEASQRYMLGGYQEETFMDSLGRAVDAHRKTTSLYGKAFGPGSEPMGPETQKWANQSLNGRGAPQGAQPAPSQTDPVLTLKERIAAGEDPMAAAKALGIDPETLTDEQWAILEAGE